MTTQRKWLETLGQFAAKVMQDVIYLVGVGTIISVLVWQEFVANVGGSTPWQR